MKVSGKGRHPKFYDPETHRSYPIKSHGNKTLILSYPLGAIFAGTFKINRHRSEDTPV